MLQDGQKRKKKKKKKKGKKENMYTIIKKVLFLEEIIKDIC